MEYYSVIKKKTNCCHLHNMYEPEGHYAEENK